MKSILSVFLLLVSVGTMYAQDVLPGIEVRHLLFKDDFTDTALSQNWAIEVPEKERKDCRVINGQLELNTDGGVTVWYRKELQGDILIEYDRTIVMDSGIHDRLSDLNQFWMATDPLNKGFTRNGGFREYDTLQMYYVGMGGNYNTTTRMRRYDGKGTLEIVGEYKDAPHLLEANHRYHIAILVKGGISTFMVDGQPYFTYTDKQPFTHGYFAIRSTRSRQRIDNFRVYQIVPGLMKK